MIVAKIHDLGGEYTPSVMTDKTGGTDRSSSISTRSFSDEMKFIRKAGKCRFEIKRGFVPEMKVPGVCFVSKALEPLIFGELENFSLKSGYGAFIPALKQIANVSSLPGIVKCSVGLPDCHSGYGFAIGNVAAFDMSDSKSVVSPGGVGFDINCGCRLIRTNLFERDVAPVKEQLTQSLFDTIPVGVGSRGVICTKKEDLENALLYGMDWSLREGYAWPEDKEHTEEFGRMLNADHTKVSARAKKRGLTQLGTLGSGNHYAEVQVGT